MKKVLLFFIAITFLACEGPMGPEGPQGPEGEPGYGTNWHVASLVVNANEWKLEGNPGDLNSYYYVDKPIKELSQFVYKEGAVIAYYEAEKGIKNGMPFVWHRGDKDNLGEFLWTETYDFDFYPGGVRFYLTYSDFSTTVKPGTETFHVVLMW